MSLTDPTYSKDKFIDFFEHIGHDAHEVGHFMAGTAIDTLEDALVLRKEVAAQFPTLVADNSKVVADVLALKGLLLACSLAASNDGANIAADVGVLEQLALNAANLVQLGADIGTLVKTLGADIAADAASMKEP